MEIKTKRKKFEKIENIFKKIEETKKEQDGDIK
jgi:hypothetical protein